jgi:hypothetical protein
MRTDGRIQQTEVVLLDEQGNDSGITFWLEDVTEAETGARRPM